MPPYRLSPEAQDDIFEIWRRISEDSLDLAIRIERDLVRRFESLARVPRLGHRRTDLTMKPVLFFPVHSFLIVYYPSQDRS